MRVGIAADHGGFDLKQERLGQLRAAGHEVADFGAHSLVPDDDYPDLVIPFANAVATGEVDRGVAVCGSAARSPEKIGPNSSRAPREVPTTRGRD